MHRLLILCTTICCAQTYDNLDATLWSQSSVEYQASVRQVYVTARYALDRALETPHWTAALEQISDARDKPPAIILDLDETVLNNSPYKARRLRDGGKPFSQESWDAWAKEARAAILPGAFEFLQYARSRGVTVFFVTNRICKAEPSDPTQQNLNKMGLGFGRLIGRTTTTDKTERRAEVTKTHRVLLLFGDDFNDFTLAPTTLEERQQILDRTAQFFGERWFIIPDPMYGSWEDPFGDNTKKKLAALKP